MSSAEQPLASEDDGSRDVPIPNARYLCPDYANCHEQAPAIKRSCQERVASVVCFPLKCLCSTIACFCKCCCKAAGIMRWRSRKLSETLSIREAGSAPPGLPDLALEPRVALDVQKTEIAVAAGDDQWLRGTLFQPNAAVSTAPGPAILLRTPYGSAMFGWLGPLLACRGYRVLIQDVRGFGRSGGRTSLAAWEKCDSAQSIAWLRAQPWCNGQVVLMGCSYDGFCAWSGLAAAVESEGVGAVGGITGVMVLSSSSDLTKRGMFSGGAFNAQLAMAWYDVMLRLHRASLRHETCCGSRFLKDILQIPQNMRATRRSRWRKMLLTSAVEGMPGMVREMSRTARTEAGADLDVPLADAENPQSDFWQDRDHSAVVAQVYTKLGDSAPRISIATGWWDVFVDAAIADFETLMQEWTAEKEHRSRLGLSVLRVPAPRLTVGPWNHFEGIETWVRDCLGLLDEQLPETGNEDTANVDSAIVSMFFLGLGPEVAEACDRQRPLGGRRCCRRCCGEPVDVVKGKRETDPKSPKTKLQHCGWKFFNAWPPPAAATCDLPLAMSSLRILRPHHAVGTDDVGTATFVFDPNAPTPSRAGAIFDIASAGRRDIALECGRPDVVVLDSPELRSPLEVAGRPRVSVFVTLSNCDSGDLFCRLLDVAPDGRVLPVCDGILRLPFQLGEPRTSSNADGLPGRWATVNLGCTAAHFATGHKIRLLFAGGAFPRFNVNKGYASDGFRGSRCRPQHVQLADRPPEDMATPIEISSIDSGPRLHRRVSAPIIGDPSEPACIPQRSMLSLPILGGIEAAAAAWDQP